MKLSLVLFLVSLSIQNSVAPPTKTQKEKEPDKPAEEGEEAQKNHFEELNLEYKRYLQEVVETLESDPDFRKKLETAEETDFRNGKVAAELEYVNHNVRTKLDELKRTELNRLRDLVKQAHEAENEVDPSVYQPPEHLDHSNPHSFEVADLHKLINKVAQDLSEADKQRREEFKEYELQKEFEKEQKLKQMDEKHKEEYVKQLEEQKKKHAQHAPLHHPGSKAQLEEVWEKQDQMNQQEFNPKTFFYLHDVDGNGYWDQNEVKALFQKELDKLYQAGAPEDDMKERQEEMERMREHVFKEADTNKDQLISYDEFIAQTKKQEFYQDEGWDPIDQQQVYTQKEYAEFEARRQKEIQRLIDKGLLPAHPAYQDIPQYHPGQHGYQQGYHPQQGYQQQQYAQGPQQHQYPNQQGYAGQHGQQPNQMYPGQMHPNQMHQGQMQPNQMHQGQMQPNQIHQGQMPPNQMHHGQMQPNQMHPGQLQPNQLHPDQMQPNQLHPSQMQPNQMHPAQMQPNQMHHPNQVQPGQIPPQNQVHTGQIHAGQPSSGQVSSSSMNPNKVPSQNNMHPNQEHPNQMGYDVPPGYHPNQMPPQYQQQHPNDIPQGVYQNQHVAPGPNQVGGPGAPQPPSHLPQGRIPDSHYQPNSLPQDAKLQDTVRKPVETVPASAPAAKPVH